METHEIQELILDTLTVQTIQGQPFLKKLGIKNTEFEGRFTLWLKSISKNKKGLTAIRITFDLVNVKYMILGFRNNQTTAAVLEIDNLDLEEIPGLVKKVLIQ